MRLDMQIVEYDYLVVELTFDGISPLLLPSMLTTRLLFAGPVRKLSIVYSYYIAYK
jgi:hypothetical protein